MTRLNQLRTQLATATQAHGAKTALAQWLATEIPTAKASSWRVKVQDFISGTDGVGGETALALAEWMAQNHPITTTPPKRGRKSVS